jgi:hypothetical protein
MNKDEKYNKESQEGITKDGLHLCSSILIGYKEELLEILFRKKNLILPSNSNWSVK